MLKKLLPTILPCTVFIIIVAINLLTELFIVSKYGGGDLSSIARSINSAGILIASTILTTSLSNNKKSS